MKLSILIVNWNTKDMVTRCIASVLKYAPSLEFEIIVVDNASSDGSLKVLKEKFGQDDRVMIISAEKNLGFGKANNIALENATGKYIFLLNSDTVVKDDSLQKMVEYMDLNSEVGVLGPKLLNSDKTLQPSVRRFPGFWNQILVFSGLHKLVRPKKYLMDYFDYSTLSDVDQVMGAALLTRKEITDKIGLFDEEFYLWYEEVDFCYQVKKDGWKINYFPKAEIIHYGGQSFSQVAVYDRKKIASMSLLHYFEKNKPVWQVYALRMIMPFVLFLTWVLNKFVSHNSLAGWYESKNQKSTINNQKLFLGIMIGFFGIEAFSMLAFRFDALALSFLVLIGILTFAISLYRLEWGVYLLFAELFIGSRGRLLEAEVFGFDLSLRMIVFIAVFAAWVIRQFSIQTLLHNFKFLILYLLLLLTIGWGIVWGYWQGNGIMNLFQDANGYLYLLIFPAVLTAVYKKNQVDNLFTILGGALIVISLKTLILFVWFTYDFYGVSYLYDWIIQNDLGEITGISGGAPRIFMQSQFWSLTGILIWSVMMDKKKFNLQGVVVLASAVLAVILSLSRSFWLGGFFGGIFAVAGLLWYFRIGFAKVIKWAGFILMIAAIEAGLLFAITSFSSDRSVTGSVSSRVSNPVTEASGNARIMLLPELVKEIKESPLFGKGFGETVSYDSFLPDRITAENPNGQITSFAFEWGYLDMLIKFGIIGLVVYLLFIANIFKQGFDNLRLSITNYQTLGILAGLVALVTLHITTPYLNHPIGVGYLILSYISFRSYDE